MRECFARRREGWRENGRGGEGSLRRGKRRLSTTPNPSVPSFLPQARLRNVKSKTDSRYSLKDGFPSPTPSTVASIKARSSSARTHRLALSREVLRQKVLKASSSKVIYRHVRGERKGTMSADAVMSNNEPKVYYRHEGRGGKEKARISVNAMRANGSVY